MLGRKSHVSFWLLFSILYCCEIYYPSVLPFLLEFVSENKWAQRLDRVSLSLCLEGWNRWRLMMMVDWIWGINIERVKGEFMWIREVEIEWWNFHILVMIGNWLSGSRRVILRWNDLDMIREFIGGWALGFVSNELDSIIIIVAFEGRVSYNLFWFMRKLRHWVG